MASFLVTIALAVAGSSPRALNHAQYSVNCQDSTPRLERLAKAIERGEAAIVRDALDTGTDVQETWRDLPPQVCRSLLLRSVWHGQDEIFRLLLERGADPLSLPRESLQIPVRDGRVEMVRMLLARGLKPHDRDELVRAGLESRNLAMLELLIASGIPIDASNVPSYYLTNEITRFLVPKYMRPDDEIYLGEGACTIEDIFGIEHADGCEGTKGPVWLHFVVMGNHEMVELMIRHGADLTRGAQVWGGGDFRPFTALQIAKQRRDRRMQDILRRAGARR